jgi:hypothetical protein
MERSQSIGLATLKKEGSFRKTTMKVQSSPNNNPEVKGLLENLFLDASDT